MASRYNYAIVVSNHYLNKTKEVKGMTMSEVRLKADEQIRKWDEQERRQREREFVADLKEQADFDTRHALATIESYKSILSHTLKINDVLDWKALEDHKRYKEIKPSLDDIYIEMTVPKPNKFFELIRSIKEKRIEKEENAKKIFEERLLDYNSKKEDYLTKQREYNASIRSFKEEFESGHADAIEKYVYMVLEKSQYPNEFEQEYDLQYDPLSGTIIVNYNLPSKEAVPKIVQHKYIASRKAIEPVEMKSKDFNTFYEDVIYQICLRTIHEVFEAVYIPDVKVVVFNGWVDGIDPKTGNDFRSCILSCMTTKDEFTTYNLERVQPKECFKNMKGISAGPLSQLAPVKPIYELNTEDNRFVESRDIMDELDASTNLAEMHWEDFEHLVRELFSVIFSRDGGEVKVTRASKDGGVDAIAFDPDPIRGGKFVIQAKRYNNVVPVSAVRDLYGTMLSEGASKGIIVTTSYFGPDSREFAKDKPITLIDGSNLVYMLQEQGQKVHIVLKNKKIS